MTIRVNDLAKELGIDPRIVLAKLRELGEDHPSTASVISPDLAQRLRAEHWSLRVRPKPAPSPPEQQSLKPVVYKGPLRDLERAFLDLVITQRHHPRQKPLPAGRYYTREVDEAKRLAERWRECVFWMTPKDIVGWSQAADPWPFRPDLAAELHARGIRAAEIGWHYDDQGEDTLADRLVRDEWTVEQVVTQVEWRRRQPA